MGVFLNVAPKFSGPTPPTFNLPSPFNHKKNRVRRVWIYFLADLTEPCKSGRVELFRSYNRKDAAYGEGCGFPDGFQNDLANQLRARCEPLVTSVALLGGYLPRPSASRLVFRQTEVKVEGGTAAPARLARTKRSLATTGKEGAPGPSRKSARVKDPVSSGEPIAISSGSDGPGSGPYRPFSSSFPSSSSPSNHGEAEYSGVVDLCGSDSESDGVMGVGMN